MKSKNTHLIREQLDTTLRCFGNVKTLSTPRQGWVRAIRSALGMNGRQLADRLQVSPSRITKLEQDELSGSVTFKTMHKTAEALDCVFVYGLVPKASLEDIVKKQVKKVATEKFMRVARTMGLEQQNLSKKENLKALKSLEEELLRTMPKYLWDTK
ncbi:MAG: mobile mystery protein A [Bacteroidales bacterium]|nr:mobile mystery protein A [Bacteroidales bacterium]